MALFAAVAGLAEELAGEPGKLKKRAAIAGAMRTEFERAGVWGLMRKRIAASLYTRAGDPMKIDCGYRPNGVIRMFQAVSLEGDVEAAKGAVGVKVTILPVGSRAKVPGTPTGPGEETKNVAAVSVAAMRQPTTKYQNVGESQPKSSAA